MLEKAALATSGRSARFGGDGDAVAHTLVAEADRDQAHSQFPGFRRGLDRKALVVLAIGNQNHVPMIAALAIEYVAEDCAETVADQRAAPRHG